jgi:hypothetical protein
MPVARNTTRRPSGVIPQVARPLPSQTSDTSEAIMTDPEVTMQQYLDGYFALMESKHAERDQAHADGFAAGWIEGFEAGIRTLLADAQIALGAAA